MLSRVAERAYWLGRYMERAENTARIIDVMSGLLLDLPRNTRYGWGALVDITGANEEFYERFDHADERNVVRYLLNDKLSRVSVISALTAARENARTTREIIPIEAWERVNDMYHRCRDFGGGNIARRARDDYVQSVIGGCQTMTGLLMGAMRHDDAFYFIRLGRNLERADMTTRIVDVGTASLLTDMVSPLGSDLDEEDPLSNALWMSVLRSLNAFQAYRQHVQERVSAEEVIQFLLQDPAFPRTVVQCLGSLEKCARTMPQPEAVVSAAQRARRMTTRAKLGSMRSKQLHTFIDKLQLRLADIHDEIAASWFLSSGSH